MYTYKSNIKILSRPAVKASIYVRHGHTVLAFTGGAGAYPRDYSRFLTLRGRALAREITVQYSTVRGRLRYGAVLTLREIPVQFFIGER